MFKATIVALLATKGLCDMTGTMHQDRVVGRATPPQVNPFGWHEFTKYTGIDAKLYIESPARGVPETFSCTEVRIRDLEAVPLDY